MPAKRGKSQAKRNTSHGTPGWVWLIAGLVLGAAAFFIVPGLLKKDGNDFVRPRPNPDAQPAAAASDDELPPPVASEDGPATTAGKTKLSKPADKPTQYDFYTLLPGREVQMSDAELAASARAEEERKARAALTQQAEAAKDDKALGNGKPNPDAAALASQQPTPLDEMTKTPSASPAPTSVAAAAQSNAVASAAGDVAYILQAGSFSASGDAEATKAKIAMLGLSARVESGQSGGKTVYRVRMGPYGTASELAEAKRKLSASGLPAMAIKAR